ncbi:hypothetical protein [Paraburkholderia aromaticivorans]|nr:hypothetical protein [Paraburkholderia aromaticivorans]
MLELLSIFSLADWDMGSTVLRSCARLSASQRGQLVQLGSIG